MEFTVTEEFVREAHRAACSTWKQRIEKEFPELFKTELKVGKWYKFREFGLHHFNGKYGNCTQYGFTNNISRPWSDSIGAHSTDGLTEATHEEVESALIAEAKKRGYKKGVTCLFGSEKNKRTISTNEIIWDAEWSGKGGLCMGMNVIFTDGKWAEILPEEKTIITKGKALRIIAKKLKVSPESIEIQ